MKGRKGEYKAHVRAPKDVRVDDEEGVQKGRAGQGQRLWTGHWTISLMCALIAAAVALVEVAFVSCQFA